MKNKFPYLPAVVYLAAIIGLEFGMAWRVHELEGQNRLLENQLHDTLSRAPSECSPVHVTCVCPEYEEGWDDAQFSEGCDTSLSEFSFEELRLMCDDLDSYDQTPGC